MCFGRATFNRTVFKIELESITFRHFNLFVMFFLSYSDNRYLDRIHIWDTEKKNLKQIRVLICVFLSFTCGKLGISKNLKNCQSLEICDTLHNSIYG